MADAWYYWHDADVIGPFTGRALAGLAADGKLLPTDTVWLDGNEQGVLASKVKHLFPPIPAELAPPNAALAAPAGTPATTSDTIQQAVAPPVEAPSDVVGIPQGWYSGSATTATARRAVAGPGAVIIGQDGTTVKFKKKCTKCGFEDSSYKSIQITRGTTRVMFYCPKCRKSRAVEVFGHVT